MPVTLNFTGTENGLQDKNGKGIGFTMVDRPSLPLVTPTNPAIPGYEPSKLEIVSDRLNITSTAGLAFKNTSSSPGTNSQVNALGTGFAIGSRNIIMQTTLVMPSAGTGKNEQAGLWFGLDEDNYVKLDIISAGSGKCKIEFVKEIAAASPATSAISTGLLTLNTSNVKLKLSLTPGTNTISSSYIIDNGSEVAIGSLSIPASFSDGKLLSDGVTSHVTFAGVFTSNRNSATPIIYSFENFEVFVAPVADSLLFAPKTLGFTLGKNETIVAKTAVLSANSGTPAINLTKSANSNWLLLPNPALGTLSFGIDTTGLQPGTYTETVTAASSGYVSAQLQVTLVWGQQCSFISPLSCSQITKNLPLTFNFNGTDGGITDKNAVGTGFTMVDKPSVPLVTPTNSSVPGYEPSKLEITGGRLNITSTAGLAFKSPSTSALTNSQVNALGTGINVNSQNIVLQTTLVSPSAGTGKNEQAGLWFGLDEDNYVKLDIISAGSGKCKIEFVKEIAAASPATNAITTGLLTLSSNNVKLKLTTNPGANTITASYIVDNGSEVTIGTLSIPASFYDGKVLSDGVTSHVSFAGIYTSNRSSATPVVYSFENFEVFSASAPPVADSLIFTPGSLSYSLTQGDIPASQSATLSSNSGTPAVALSKSANSNWLILPGSAIGTLSFGIDTTGLVPGTYTSTVTASSNGYISATLGITFVLSGHSANSILFTQSSQNVEVEQGSSQSLLEYIATSDNVPVNVNITALDPQNTVPTWLSINGNMINGINYTTGSEISFDFDATNLSIGSYTAVVKASAPGYNEAVLNISLTVKSGTSGTLSDIMVNFQDSLTVPPAGWLRDYGQAFGARTSANQGTGLSYGWLKRDDNTPLNLTKNTRKRTTPADVLSATFIHMQANDIASFSGTKIEGIWEVQVANGNYDVTVSVGDADYTDSRHSINIEGVNAIIGFVPTTANKFKTSTISVSVADGFLTMDAIGGTNTKLNWIRIKPTTTRRPSVVLVNPENSSQNVSDNASVSTSILNLPNAGVDNNTITTSSVYLTEEATGTVVPSHVNGTGGGDAITLVPSAPLKLHTTYVFTITDQVKDLSGASFIPYSSSFTTASVSSGEVVNARFDKIVLPNTEGRHSSLTVGPDGKLYALGIDGLITRFAINNDGTLATPDTLYSLQREYGTQQPCLAIGFAFDPASTATNLIVWITHSTFVFLNGPQWDGKLTRLSGANLENVQDIIVNLPRSAKDHLTNSIAFGPDGALYFTQGSVSAMGRADNTWGNRNEPMLSAAVLRLDVSKLTTLPLDAKTPDGGGTYNPYAANAPLTIYASGVRNAYDLVWHSNGNLYTPTNGSAAGGNTPASVNGTLRTDGSTYNGPVIPALTNVQQTQKDFLFRIVKGGYYGHPNPTRGEYVMNGGNPTNAIDPAQVDAYPVGTMPDPNWRGYSFDFQNNKSPDGAIEYKSNTFNGALKGKLLVVRYSQHDDIIVLTPGGPDNDIISSIEGSSIEGFSGFIDPLDLTEDVNTGNIYVSEYGGNGNITLLRPKVTAGAGTIAVSPDKIYDNDISGGVAGANRTVTVTNTGSGSLSVSAIALTGANTDQFVVNGLPAFPKTVAPGGSFTFTVAFNPTSLGLKTAGIAVASDDANKPSTAISLRGLGTAGSGGTNEPSLQTILDVREIPVNVGDDNSATTIINADAALQKAPLLGEEVSLQKFQKAGTENVTIEPLGVFNSTDSATVLALGWYKTGDITTKSELFTVPNNPVTNGQTINVNYTGSLSFDPGGSSFGFYTRWPVLNNRYLYSEDNLNTFAGSIPHHVRVYPLKDAGGIVANAYIVAFEENTTGFEYQDVLFIVRNVIPAPQNNTLLFVENPDKFPSNDVLVFSKIQTPWSRDNVTYNANHDSVVLRVNNKGINPLIISNLLLSNDTAWTIEKLNGVAYTPSALPIAVSSGSFADIKLRFIATATSGRVKIFKEKLTIVSNDDVAPAKVISLNGLWQAKGEGSNEPYAQEMIEVFGFKTSTGFSHTDPDLGNPAKPKGDEIVPMYFVRADTSKPVSVRQMAAYHGCCYYSEYLRWFPKGTTTLATACGHIVADGQTLLPRRSTPNNPTEGVFSPTTAFGLKIGDADWTDTTKNPGRKLGVRVWKAKDANGNIIPNAYIVANDYLGTSATNYDYNDNMYFISNLRPETGAAFYSALGSTPSALDFGEKVLQTGNSLQLTLSSLGKTYPNGSADPALTISSVVITGDNKSEFSAAMPALTTLSPQQSTTLTVNFNPVSEGLKIADLLIYYNNSQSPYRVPLYGIAKLTTTTVTADVRINSGSATPLTINGKTWSADNQYSFDNLEPFTNSSIKQIAGTDEDSLYLKEQSSNADKRPFRYEIPLANGDYKVRLHFAEIYWGAPGSGLNGGAGSRVMSVKLENQLRLINFDVSKEVGGATAIVKNFPVTVTDGKLNIDFSATVNRPLVCAVEVYRFSAASPRPFIAQAADTSNTRAMFSMQETAYGATNNFEKPKIFPNPMHSRFVIQFPSRYQGLCDIQLTDILGQAYRIGTTKLSAGGSDMQVDISKLSLKAGIYFLKIKLEDKKTEVFKLVIE